MIRRGVIEAVGSSKDTAIPFDAEVIDGKGLTVYPGFIDLYTTLGQRPGIDRSQTGRGKPVDLAESPLAATPADNRRGLTPEFEAASVLDLTEALVEPRRRLGFTDVVSAPAGAIATGQSALFCLSGLPRRESVLKAPVALHVHLATPTDPPLPTGNRPDAQPQQGPRRRMAVDREGGTENPYPRALMGSVAHLRQAMLDAQYHHRLLELDQAGEGARAPYDPALQTLWQARQKTLPVWWEADSRDEIHRALDLAAEFGTRAVIVGGREAAKVADRLKAEHVAVVLRLNFPEEPRVPSEDEYRRRPVLEQDDPLKVLAHRKELWTEQVATAAALAKAGVTFAFATEGLDRPDRFPAQMRALIAAGLSADSALAALTGQAAAIVGFERRLGTLEPGKLGHAVAFTGPFQNEQSRARFVLVDGLKFEIKPPEPGSEDGRPGARRGQGPRGEGRGNPPPRGASPAAGPVAGGPGTGHTAGTLAKQEAPSQPDNKPGAASTVQAPKVQAPKPEVCFCGQAG